MLKRYLMNMTKIRKARRARSSILSLALILFILSQAGCGPTYPKEIVNSAIVQLCREEYSIDVKVEIAGKTVGVYLPIEGLFNAAFAISKEASEKINDVLLSISRVTLSSDAPLDFYMVIAQDPLLPEVEVVLIRYVRDLKMLHYEQISRGEFAKRMIIDVKLTPQIQKEKVLRGIFGKLNIEEADGLIDDYLKASEVATIGEIGYWNDSFFIKDITMPEFLSLQIAERAKIKFFNDPGLRQSLKLNQIMGEFLEESGRSLFRFSFEIALVALETAPGVDLNEGYDTMFKYILEEAADVMHGYKFEDFWNIEIINAGENNILFAAQDELEDFRKKKKKYEEFRRWHR